MISNDISVDALREMIALKEKKQNLEQEVDQLDRQIESLASGGAPGKTRTAAASKRSATKKSAKKASKKAAKKATKKAAKKASKKAAKKAASNATGAAQSPDKSAATRKRGGLSNKIFRALRSAGDEGLTVRDMASKFKINPQNLFVWFSATGKNHPEIKKVGTARYALVNPDSQDSK